MKKFDKLDDKLSLYAGLSVNTDNKGSNVRAKLKSSLLTLAPFAAGALMMPGAAMAQCGQGVAVSNPAGGAFGDGIIDVDGDGVNDFQFDIVGDNLFITPLGTMSVGLYSGFPSYANFVNAGGTIDANAGDGWANTGSVIASYQLTGGTAFIFYIPIRDAAGNYGFIEINTDGAGGFTMDTAASGVSTNTAPVIAGNCASLPVELTSFNATAKGQNVLLQWETASEINNNGFEVQRSMDGVSFHKVAWVQGEGNSDRTVQYQSMDESASANTLYYYRLRQIDFDGAESFSAVEKVEIAGRGIVVDAYPNPTSVSSQLKIDVNSPTASTGNLQFFNISGQKISLISLELVKGQNQIAIPTEGLVAGSYFAKVSVGADVIYKKIVLTK